MTANDSVGEFDETQYENETRQRWGDTPQYAESQREWAAYSKDQKDAIKAQGGRLTIRMVGEDLDASPDDPEVQAAIGEYHAYLNRYFYACEVDFLRGLADGWVAPAQFNPGRYFGSLNLVSQPGNPILGALQVQTQCLALLGCFLLRHLRSTGLTDCGQQGTLLLLVRVVGAFQLAAKVKPLLTMQNEPSDEAWGV